MTRKETSRSRNSWHLQFEADRLTVALRHGGQRPDKFESTPGSGVTLVVLKTQAAGGNWKLAGSPGY